MVLKTRIRAHRRRKPGGGYVTVKEHMRTVKGSSNITHKDGKTYYGGKELPPDDYYRCLKCNKTKSVSEFPTEENICGKCYREFRKT